MAFQRNQKLNLLRLAVLLIVALAGVKFLFRDSLTLELHRHTGQGGGFWGRARGSHEEPRAQGPPGAPPAAQRTEPRPEPPQRPQRPQNPVSSGAENRLVHLDLKGAAPKISYLEQLFPLLSQLGATGVLVEYEDMFPFQGDLGILRSPYAYRSAGWGRREAWGCPSPWDSWATDRGSLGVQCPLGSFCKVGLSPAEGRLGRKERQE
ncbi:uncharacterized protein LOC119942282 [Tachyglossus aculeatus]|uniref:uncharacterized protein LOC119942282 n=1 Tax=Tachyglossus aculeatus TaxID=9261 RepID=UPI0018F72957|nr:uncharacterized protein LOC119942282 [Tachyglossus aculeatus]